MSAHDRWLARYRSYATEAYCKNEKCVEYGEPVTVDYQEEYGQGSITPEECPLCRQTLTLEPPPEIEDDDEEE